MRVAMLMADGFEDSEFRHPYDGLLAAAHEVVAVGPAVGMVLIGKKGTERKQVDFALSSAVPANFDAVVIPGGYSPDPASHHAGCCRLRCCHARGWPAGSYHLPQLLAPHRSGPGSRANADRLGICPH
jgi:DJ-1/PfpI family protein